MYKYIYVQLSVLKTKPVELLRATFFFVFAFRKLDNTYTHKIHLHVHTYIPTCILTTTICKFKNS